jgi:hypothetical protein
LVLAAVVFVFTVCVERADAEFAEGPATNLGPAVNSSYVEDHVTVTDDGLELIFSSTREGGEGRSDLWMSRRSAPNEPWPEPVNLGPAINSEDNESTPAVSADGLELYFASDRSDSGNGLSPWDDLTDPTEPADIDLYVTKRASRSKPWGPAENLRQINRLEYDEVFPEISSDGLELYYKTDREQFGGGGGTSMGLNDFFIFKTSRASKDDHWTLPVYVGPTHRGPETKSQSRVYSTCEGYFRVFYGQLAGGYGYSDLWQVQVEPVLDFNGDGIVDVEDVSRLADYWGQEESSVDIAPGPYGDGVVDFNDLELLMSYWEQEVNDLSLIAHWKLDETDGNTASDSAGGCDGVVYGEPLWQPDSGMVGGALEFDGIDDRIVVEHSLSDSEYESFSIIAWINGGSPGQAIFSQYTEANWLMTGSNGELVTVLNIGSSSGRGGGRSDDWKLESGAVITDGRWHRVVFVWDEDYADRYGYNTILYVDGTEVETGWQDSLGIFTGDMLIGAGRDSQAGEPQSLWTGLIDDVRVYKRAVKP